MVGDPLPAAGVLQFWAETEEWLNDSDQHIRAVDEWRSRRRTDGRHLFIFGVHESDKDKSVRVGWLCKRFGEGGGVGVA